MMKTNRSYNKLLKRSTLLQHILCVAAGCFACCLPANAQNDTVAYVQTSSTLVSQPENILSSMGKAKTTITNAKMLGVGAVNILDTYLSSEKYYGTELRFISLTNRQPVGRRVSRQLTHHGSLAYADNRSGNGGEIAGMYNFGYAWHYNLNFLSNQLNVKVGGMIDANLGFIYNTRNSNNPAQARVYFNLSPSAVATYYFAIKNRPLALRYEVSAPLCGIMFSPNYGQSYYEIFNKGNYDHNVVPTTFISTPSLRQMLTLDFQIGRSTLRLGYLGDYQQARVNNLKSHIYTHALVVGFVKQFTLVKL